MIGRNSQTRFHQIATVRQKEKLSLSTLSRRLGMSVKDVRYLEDEYHDVPISILHRCATALQVPVSELLREGNESQCPRLRQRLLLVRAMKTVEAIRSAAAGSRLCVLADNLRNQLVEIMPELAEIKPWPQVGTIDMRLGRIATMTIPDPPCDFELKPN